MSYGSQRLISVRESPNNRRAFDAVRLLTRVGDWGIDAFVSRPVEIDRGVFDDWGLNDTKFWGVYATHLLPFLNGASVDLYYLGLDRPDAELVAGTADEQRHSIGGRFYGTRGAWNYNFEGVFQWGTFGDGDIRAWTLASDTGYTFVNVPGTPRVGLRADVISGDTDRDDEDLGTFNPLFPRGGYFGEISLIGPANLLDLHPILTLQLTENMTLLAEWPFFWRYSTDDGIYANNLEVLRGADGSARFVGHEPSIAIEWQIDRHITFAICYSRFFAGEFTKASGPGADVDFVVNWIRYRF